MVKCIKCNRNYEGLNKELCPNCAKWDYMYSQGALTTEQYNKLIREWL